MVSNQSDIIYFQKKKTSGRVTAQGNPWDLSQENIESFFTVDYDK